MKDSGIEHKEHKTNRSAMNTTKLKTPCITYAKAVTFDVPKFTSS